MALHCSFLRYPLLDIPQVNFLLTVRYWWYDGGMSIVFSLPSLPAILQVNNGNLGVLATQLK